MSKSLGQPVVAENRPGAGGNIGVDVVAKSAPDGYTIGLAAAGALVINQHLMGKLPYDPVKDLAPVSKLADIPIVVAVANSTPVGSVQDLIAAAKAKPGALAFGSAGNGTAMHLSGELFKQMAGIDMTHVPYKGSAPAVTDLVAGQLPVAFVDLVSALPQIRAGRVKAGGRERQAHDHRA
jgi:tripartite-type tricarboxylate transporter receptor subunit TctC